MGNSKLRQVFLKVVRFMIESTGKPNVIFYGGNHLGLPSWLPFWGLNIIGVPDWRDSRSLLLAKIASKLPLYHSIKRHHDIRFGAVQQDEPLLQFMELLNDTTAAAAGKSMVDARIEEPTQETLTSVTSGRVIDTITVFLDGSEDDLVTLPARSWSVKEGLLQTLSNLHWPRVSVAELPNTGMGEIIRMLTFRLLQLHTLLYDEELIEAFWRVLYFNRDSNAKRAPQSLRDDFALILHDEGAFGLATCFKKSYRPGKFTRRTLCTGIFETV
jgi:hypothetical protein